MKVKYLSLFFSLIFSNQFLFCMQPQPSSSTFVTKDDKRLQRKQEKQHNIEKLCEAILGGNDIEIESILKNINYPSVALGRCLIELNQQLTPELVNRLNRFNADMNYVDGSGHNILEILAKNGINIMPYIDALTPIDNIPQYEVPNYKKHLIESLIMADVQVNNAIKIAKKYEHPDLEKIISKVLAAKREVLCEGGAMILSTLLFYIFIVSVIYSSYNNQV